LYCLPYCFSILYQEIDYINEGRNADRFRRDFRNVKWVRVPVSESKQVLCLVGRQFELLYYWNLYYTLLMAANILGLHISQSLDA
jgi:hypothetical protein